MEARERRRALAAIFACVTIYGLTLGLVRPLLALILESRGLEKSLIGLNATMPAFGMMIVAPFIPRLIRLLGIRYFLLACLLVDVSMILSYPLMDNFYIWCGISLIAGASTNALLVASETWINEIAIDATRGRVLAIYNAMLIAAMAIGPTIIPLAGIKGWLPFLIGAGFVMLASLPLFWVSGSTMQVQGKSSFNLVSFVLVAPVLCLAILLFAWKEFAGGSLLPVYGVTNGLGQSEAALMLTVLGLGALVLTFVFGWLADHMNRYLLLVFCGIGILLGALLLPLVINAGSTLWILLFVWGGLFSGLYTVVMTIVGQRFRGVELVVANISIGIVWGIGSLTGPSVTGIAMDIWDPHGFVVFFVSASFLFVLVSILRWVMTKDRSKVL